MTESTLKPVTDGSLEGHAECASRWHTRIFDVGAHKKYLPLVDWRFREGFSNYQKPSWQSIKKR